MEKMTEQEIKENPKKAIRLMIEILEGKYQTKPPYCLCEAIKRLLGYGSGQLSDGEAQTHLLFIGITRDDVIRLTPELAASGYTNFWFSKMEDPASRIIYLKKKLQKIEEKEYKMSWKKLHEVMPSQQPQTIKDRIEEMVKKLQPEYDRRKEIEKEVNDAISRFAESEKKKFKEMSVCDFVEYKSKISEMIKSYHLRDTYNLILPKIAYALSDAITEFCLENNITNLA